MKRIFALFLLFSLALCTHFPSEKRTVKAETSYAYIPDANVAFYSDSEEASRLLLFYLPKSYFVCILGETEGYYRVSYLEDKGEEQQLTGFVEKSRVTPVAFTPETPYLHKKIEVTYYASGNADLSGDILSRITVTCVYYGDYSENGKTYCYVLRGDRFGYVDRPMGFTYPENPEYSQKTASEEPPSPSPEDASGLSPAQIVFLVLLCLLIPTLAALILRPSRKKNFPDDDSPE